MSFLSLENIHKTFAAQTVLTDINVGLEQGEFLVLVGPSGCGKSTLLNIIAGLETASRGRVLIGARDVTAEAPANRDIAMVFQSYALYPNMTVRQNITFGLEMRKVPRVEREAKCETVAKMLHIEHLLNRKPSQLSGGQRQRVAMGRALTRQPKLFLFDEPLSNLDAKLRVEMRAEIKKLHQDLGATMVYVTHDQIEAMTLADKIVVMRSGLIQQIGAPAEVYSRPSNLFVADFMGSPAMNLIPARAAPAERGCRIEIERAAAPPLTLHDTQVSGLPPDIVFGIRPEHITDAAAAAPERLQTAPCRIDIVEPAGADTYVVFALGGKALTARLSAETAAHAGESITLAFDMAKVSYFAPDSGRRLN